MAPSMIRMRCLAAALKRGDALFAGHAVTASWRGHGLGPQPQQVADGVDEIGAVQRVEVELADALIDQVHHLLGCHGGGDEMGRLRIVVEAVEAPRQPGRHGRPAPPRKARHLLEIVDRHDAGHDRRPDAARARRLQEAQVVRVVEEELRDDARGARIDLGFEVVEIGIDAAAVGVLLGIAGDRDLEVRRSASGPQRAPRHWRSRRDAARTCAPAPAGGSPRRATMWSHARRLVGARHLVDFGVGRLDAGQVRRGHERRLAHEAATVACVRSRVEPPAP